LGEMNWIVLDAGVRTCGYQCRNALGLAGTLLSESFIHGPVCILALCSDVGGKRGGAARGKGDSCGIEAT
jgi:hypothetical protein